MITTCWYYIVIRKKWIIESLRILKVLFGIYQFSFCWYALACRANMTATLWAFCTEYYLWPSDWLSLLGWLAAWNLELPAGFDPTTSEFPLSLLISFRRTVSTTVRNLKREEDPKLTFNGFSGYLICCSTQTNDVETVLFTVKCWDRCCGGQSTVKVISGKST